ncbi:MAG: TadE/TadG family type IV pilus assembly protein [Acidimicrobiales bacterium]
MGRHDRRARGQGGAALVEMAIVLPLLLMLLYGIISFGAVFLVDQTIKQAASDGARAALAGTTQATETSLARARASGDLAYLSTRPTVATSPAACSPPSQGNCMTVTVSYDYGAHPLIPALPGLGLLIPSTLTAQTTVAVNH